LNDLQIIVDPECTNNRQHSKLQKKVSKKCEKLCYIVCIPGTTFCNISNNFHVVSTLKQTKTCDILTIQIVAKPQGKSKEACRLGNVPLGKHISLKE